MTGLVPGVNSNIGVVPNLHITRISSDGPAFKQRTGI